MSLRNHALRLTAAAVFLASLLALLLRGLEVETSFADLLPGGKSVASEAFDRLSRVGARQVNMLFRGETPEAAAEAARKVAAALPEEVELMAADGGVARIADALSPYRFQLLSARHRELLQSGQTEALCEEGMANLYSFIPLSLYPPEEEPYGFASAFLLENPMLSFPGMVPENGVLTGEYKGTPYACLPLLLPQRCADSPAELDAVMRRVAAACGLREDASCPAGREGGVMLSGTPVHTWLTSQESMRTMGILGIVSTLMVVLLFRRVFRSLRGLAVMVLTLSAGALAAAGAVSALFGHVHILALVFACSLVGLSTDYMVHYLVVHGREDGEGAEGMDAGFPRSLGSALLAGFASTVGGYLLFCLCGMPLLSQIAVLAIAGLGGVVLFMFAFYEPLYRGRVPVRLDSRACRWGRLTGKRLFPCRVPWILALLLAVPCLWLGMNDDLRSFYEPPPHLLEAEKVMAGLSGQENGVLCVLVQGKDAAEVLAREEQVTARLRDKGVHYRAVSSLVPSPARQEADFRLVQPFVQEHEAELPVSPAPEWHGPLMPETVFSASNSLAALAPLWGGTSSLIIAGGCDRAALAAAVEGMEDVSVEDRFGDLKAGIGEYRHRLFVLLGCALVLAWGIFALRRKPWAALRLMGPVVGGVMAVFGGLALCGVPVTLFHVLGCFLVVGLGFDYVVFRDAQGEEKNVGLAVALSFLTTLLMFGVLAVTSFAVTRDIGITISLGLTVTFLLSSAASPRRP